MEHRWAELDGAPGLAEEGPHPQRGPRAQPDLAGVMRAWGPQADLEPEFNRKASSTAALISHAESSQPQWESGVALPEMSWGWEGDVSQPLLGSAGEL